MGPWPIGVSAWTLRERSLPRAIDRVAAAGYDAIELSIGPELSDAAVRRAITESGLLVSSLSPGYDLARDTAHSSAGLRRAAVDHLRRMVELAGELAAPVVIVVPSDRTMSEPGATRDDEFARAAHTLAEVARTIPPGGPLLVIEPLNRYETHLVRTVAEAAELCLLAQSAHVALMGDVFHMNIEESATADALQRHAGLLRHAHLADNQRGAPGTGQLDLAPILALLASTDYAGSLVMEFVPADAGALVAGRVHVEGLISRLAMRS